MMRRAGRLRHRLVGEAHHVEGGQSGRDLHLHIDRARLDPLERDRGYPLDHRSPRMRPLRVAEAVSYSKNI